MPDRKPSGWKIDLFNNAVLDNASIHHNIDQATIDRWFIEHRMVLYMNASRLSKFSFVLTDRMGCSSISGLVAADTAAAGPYEIR